MGSTVRTLPVATAALAQGRARHPTAGADADPHLLTISRWATRSRFAAAAIAVPAPLSVGVSPCSESSTWSFVGVLLARPTADAADIAELTGLEVDDAEKLLARLEAAGAILPVGHG